MVGSTRAVVVAAAFMAAAGLSQASATEVLVMDSDAVLNNSAVGQHIRERLEEIAAEMETELQAQGAPLQERWQAFQEETSTLSAESLQENPTLLEQGRDLQGQIFQLNVTEQVLARELVATRVQALRPVRQALDTVLEALVEERNADILVERNVLIFVSEEANVTNLVIERLDAAISDVEVERVRIPVEEVEAATAAAAAENGE